MLFQKKKFIRVSFNISSKLNSQNIFIENFAKRPIIFFINSFLKSLFAILFI